MPRLDVLEDRTLPSTFTVLNLADMGSGSLRQAIVDANANPGANEIDFAPALSGTITLTSGQLRITNDLTIVGPGADELTVSGNDASRVFDIQAKQQYTFTTIDVAGSTDTVAPGINTFTQIAGWYVVGGTTHGFLRQSNGSIDLLPDVPGSTLTRFQGINDSGQISGFYGAGGTTHGFLLSGGSYSTFDPPGSTRTEAYQINASGQIVGLYDDAGGTRHGFLRLSDGSYGQPLDFPGSTSTSAVGINASGQIVGHYNDAGGNTHGFLLSGGSYTMIPDVPGSTLTRGIGINDAGEIVGFYISGGTPHAFVLSEGSYTTFDEPDATTFTGAFGINASGQIVGRYDDASGMHGFLATPIHGGVTVTIAGLTIAHGRADNGAGIRNAGGSLILSHDVVSQNQAQGAPGTAAQGGGVFNGAE